MWRIQFKFLIVMSRSLSVGAGWTDFEVSLFEDIRYRLRSQQSDIDVEGQALGDPSRVRARWLLLLLFKARGRNPPPPPTSPSAAGLGPPLPHPTSPSAAGLGRFY